MRLLLLIVAITFSMAVTAQVGIGVNFSNVEPSAQLEVSSTSKGFLVPRMTSSQRVAIANPATGLLVYQTDAPIGFYYFTQGKWKQLGEQDITMKLSISDTASMLSSYARVQRMLDSLFAVQTRLEKKFNTGDTASMLSGYARVSRLLDSIASVHLKLNLKLNSKDTASLSKRIDANKKGIIDTAAAIRSDLQLTNLEIQNIFTTNSKEIVDTGNAIRSALVDSSSDICTALLDTASNLRSAINLKLNISDTALMLSNRFARNTDSSSSRINEKLNSSDTSLMLSNRFARDTASLSSRIDLKVNIADTSSMLTSYLRKSDTSAMLSNRFERDTASLSSRINLKLSSVDTTNMLTSYLRKSDTSAMLSNRFARDTASLSARINSKSSLSDTSLLNLESRFATKLNKTDTASLSERINTKLNSSVIDLGNQTGIIIYWDENLNKFRTLAPGTAGQVLKMSSGTNPVPVWGTDATTSVPAFSPCGTTISDIDGNSYNTVLIGAQCWTKENLRVRRYNNGTSILFDTTGGSGGSSTTWQNLKIGAHTIYAHDSTATTPSNLTKYGYLYNWYAAKGIYTTGNIQSTDTLNICPSGWHVPTDADWTTLTTELGGESVAGGKMKSVGTAYWNSSNTGATNESGFSALPGGYRDSGGSFYDVRNNAFFWSATEGATSNGRIRSLIFSNGNVTNTTFFKSVGASIRCLRN